MMKKVKLNKHELTAKDFSQELERVQYKKKFWTFLQHAIYVLMAIAATSVLIVVLWLPVLRIYGTSMDHTLKEGQIVLAQKGSKFDTGDVIAFYYNNKILTKRVIGKSGDWIDINAEGQVYVNQKQLDEPYVEAFSLGQSNITYPYQVPDGQIFVLGDNRATSIDSRNTAVGGVTEEQIVGKIFFKVWPLDSIGLVE